MKRPTISSASKAIPDRIIWSIAGFLILKVSLLSGQENTAAPELPIPSDFNLAESATANIAASNTLPPEAKNLVQAHFQELKSEFTQLRRPLREIYDEYLKQLQNLDSAKEKHERLRKAHDAKPHDFTESQTAEISAYNQEKKDLDKLKASILEQKDQIDAGYKQAWANKAKPFDEWRQKSLGEFNKIAQGLLDGKLQFRKGLAWNQLVEAAKGAEHADFIFNGSENSDSNVVDTRGLRSGLPKSVDNAISEVYADAPPGVSGAVERGFQAVMKRDWKLAKAWFEDARNRDPSNIGLQRLVALADYTQTQNQSPPAETNRPAANPPTNMGTDDERLSKLDATLDAIMEEQLQRALKDFYQNYLPKHPELQVPESPRSKKQRRISNSEEIRKLLKPTTTPTKRN